ncbi:MAG: MFS transporter [Anaerolineae bacterium]
MTQAFDRVKPRWAAPFFTIWSAQALSLLGSSVAQFALVWWLTQGTGSATVLATAMLMGTLPGIIVGPFAGALVDRWNRRVVMMAADTISAVAAALLAYLFWMDALQIWQVYAIMLVRSVAGTFHYPAMQASTTLMVPDEQLARVGGMNQTLFGAMSIVSAPLGALTLSLLPLHGIMAIDVLTAALAVIPLFWVHVPQPPRTQAAAGPAQVRATLLADMRDGLRYVWSMPGLVALMFLAMFLNFTLYPVFTLVPLLVTEHFRGGAAELGWMNSAWGIGLVVGGLLLGVWGGFRRRIVTTLFGVVGLGVGIVIGGAMPPSLFGVALGGVLLAGLMNSICNGSVMALMQSVVAPEMQGRFFTVVNSLSSAMAPLGLVLAGPVADALGIQVWFWIGGLTQVVFGLAGFFIPVIMHIEHDRPSLAPAE